MGIFDWFKKKEEPVKTKITETVPTPARPKTKTVKEETEALKVKFEELDVVFKEIAKSEAKPANVVQRTGFKDSKKKFVSPASKKKAKKK